MRNPFHDRLASNSHDFVLLAPRDPEVPTSFHQVVKDQISYRSLLHQMQRLRGRIYQEDGAIDSSQLTDDGRHHLDSDERCWHLLVMAGGHVQGCMRYMLCGRTTRVSELNVLRSALAKCTRWGPALGRAVEEERAMARRQGVGFGEAGGWALARELRRSTEALRMVLGIFSLAQLLGQALVLSTATKRNNSAAILRRLGGRSLVGDNLELPPYFDPHYRCEMELLRFDSREPSPKYREMVETLRNDLRVAPVVCHRTPSILKYGQRASSSLAGTPRFPIHSQPVLELLPA